MLLTAAKQLGIGGVNLVTISGLQWNQELSPWPIETVVSKDDRFTGGADQFLAVLTTDIVSQVEALLDETPAWRGVAGYSMGGLFAAYCGLHSTLFTRILSASGSMWYPGWLEYIAGHEFAGHVAGVYLSVGDKESASRNAVLQTVGERTRQVADIIASREVQVKFELNPGNHFKNPPLRVMKGVKWLLENT